MAGQFAEMLNDTKNLPFIGTMMKCMCCAMTRNSYQFTGGKASAHPPIELVWKKETNADCQTEYCYSCVSCDCAGCCCCPPPCCRKKKIEEAPKNGRSVIFFSLFFSSVFFFFSFLQNIIFLSISS